MSLVFDKGKYKNHSKLDQLKIKNNNYSNIFKNNPKKNSIKKMYQSYLY